MFEGAPHPAVEWVLILATFYGTYEMVTSHVRPLTSRFWTVVLSPLWFGLVYAGVYMVYALVHYSVQLDFGTVGVFLGAIVGLVLIPAPLNYGVMSLVLDERRLTLIMPMWLMGGWAMLFVMVFPILAAVWGGWTLATGD